MNYLDPSQCATFCNCKTRPKKRAIQYLETSYQSLSPEDQIRADRDLYGDEEPIDESPAFIDGRVEELRKELNLINSKKKSAYVQAINKATQNAGRDGVNYVNSDKFYLLFLRAERFNTKMAAQRMVRYFKEKLELFGHEKLDCKIKQADLNEQEITALYEGAYCITGATDKAGRLIIFVRALEISFHSLASAKRIVFYLLHNAIEDNEETQKKGYVMITHTITAPAEPLGSRKSSKVRSFHPLRKMVHYALPFRVAALHHCYNDLSFHLYLGFIIMVLPKSVLPRIHCHYGTNIDCMCELLAYGIDGDTLPITLQNEYRDEIVRGYLRWRRSLEEGEPIIGNDNN